jgi:hypothetical protein
MGMPTLDFKPHKSPPKAMPTCVWKEWVLFSGEHPSSIDLSSQSFHEAYGSIYDSLSFYELAQLVLKAEAFNIEVQKQELFSLYGFRFDGKSEKVLRLLQRLPQPFLQWIEKHSLSAGDLYPLCALSAEQLPLNALNTFSELNPSRATGAQILELLTECILMNMPVVDFFKGVKSSQEILDKLQQLRYPQTLERDHEKKKVLSSPWPKTFTTRWQRQGDRSGLDVRFFVASKRELAEKIESLKRVHDDLKD